MASRTCGFTTIGLVKLRFSGNGCEQKVKDSGTHEEGESELHAESRILRNTTPVGE